MVLLRGSHHILSSIPPKVLFCRRFYSNCDVEPAKYLAKLRLFIDFYLFRDTLKQTRNFSRSCHVGQAAEDRQPRRSGRKIRRFSASDEKPSEKRDDKSYQQTENHFFGKNRTFRFRWRSETELRANSFWRFI